ANYKRVPRGFDVDHPRADLLLHDSLFVNSPQISPSVLKKPALVDVCYEYALIMKPIHNWLNQLSR
ncbi:MAG: DUF2461 family protein, partial [Candidatus Thorarchaeota archaeon]